MSSCLAKLPHSCGTSDALQVFEDDKDQVTGYCFRCNTYVPHPLGEDAKASDIPKEQRPVRTREDILKDIAEIGQLSTIDLKDRRLRADTLERFGVKVGYSEEDGKTPHFVHFPYTREGRIVRYKTRILDSKKMWSIGIEREVDLFGWEQAKASGAKRLIITEGEFDAIALTRILEIKTSEMYKDSMPAVVSIVNGAAGAAKEIGRNLDLIRAHFKDISLCFDDDEAGQEAVDSVCKLCPDFKTIILPDKDANECLLKGHASAAYKAVTFNARENKNTKLVWGFDLHDKAKVKAEWGLSWPWVNMTELTRGIRYGETYYIAAGEKMGKSEIVNALGAHLIQEHGLKIMMAKPEESNVKSYKLLASKVAARIFHDPKIEFDEDAYEKAGQVIKNNVCMLNLYQNITWSALKADIYSAVAMNVKAVFIDPITNLTNGMSSGEANEFLQGLAQELAALAKDLDIVIFIFCHLNKPSKGSTPWDRGGKITTDYFAGSSAMARSCNYAIGLEGNKDPDLPMEERNIRKFVILADREYGETGGIRLYWDYKTGMFNEIRE